MSKVTQMKTVNFQHVSKDVLAKVQAAGILPKRGPLEDPQFEVTMATLKGQPVLSHSLECDRGIIGDGTLANAIKKLTEISEKWGFVGGPENVQVVNDEKYVWGDLYKFTMLFGWRSMTPKQVAQFKEFKKIADEAQKVADLVEAERLVKKAEQQKAYAESLIAEANALLK